MDAASETTTPKKRLALKRETVRDLNDPILTTQGWSLWTCEETADMGRGEGGGEQGG
ncbi:hypothetical protein ABZU32_05585 [Sphaerisporangium sp. NPDC005288]|uniref:hypothetical protein n=1 Tax=Sphaerisporangium sp. NPDC005288 TaxID=3155114 RepID=UPI0033B27396